ncbi:Uncharacterised protein [uncultured archaeon]|nr:Uncharacterised protein [uncultured archaeon]
MKKDPEVFLEHILESIELIENYTANKTISDFIKSVQFQDSIIRRIEIIGEAVKNLPDDVKNSYPEVPWKKIAGMRDVLIHEYFGIDLELTWQVVQKDIPDLKREIMRIRHDLKTRFSKDKAI